MRMECDCSLFSRSNPLKDRGKSQTEKAEYMVCCLQKELKERGKSALLRFEIGKAYMALDRNNKAAHELQQALQISADKQLTKEIEKSLKDLEDRPRNRQECIIKEARHDKQE